MKKLGKVIIIVLIVVLIAAGAALSYVKFALPDIGEAPDLKVEITPARLERGEYLATHVSACVDCHSTRDWTRFAGPIEPGSIGSGGELFDQKIGFPGEVYVPNITPYHLKEWTDGELYRAIAGGVKKDGSAIFPIMPYKFYGQMDKEDIYSIIAYIRTLPAKETGVPERKLNFPLNFLVNTMPSKADPRPVPSENSQVAYGAYLVNAAACKDCHTKKDNGTPLEGMDYAGGSPFQLTQGTVYSSNITPDNDTGIGKWTREQFVTRFKSHEDPSAAKVLADGDRQTIMPWTVYGGMKVKDLEAMYAYLRTVKPVNNEVIPFE